MPDTIKMTVEEIAELVGGKVKGDGKVVISGVSSLDEGTKDTIGFMADPRYKEKALKSGVGAVIVPEPLETDKPQVVSADPYASFVKLMGVFHPEEDEGPGIHPTAVVDSTAKVATSATIGPLAAVGEDAVIGERTIIGAGCVIGPRAEVGDDCRLHPRVTVYRRSVLGNRVTIHSGTVIGADGFGFILGAEGHKKKPQVGITVIEDDVEIGANCTIDRAMLDRTVVGAGTKIDNLVHLAHNVHVGRHCLILAGAISGGSVTIGDFSVISGGVIIRDNVTIGERVMVIGGSGVADDIESGETVFGYPSAMPFSTAKRVYSRMKNLPDLFKRVRALEKKLVGKD